MKLKFELENDDVLHLCLLKMRDLTSLPIKLSDLRVQVKSKFDHKAEWEEAYFRVIVQEFQYSFDITGDDHY